MAMSRYGHLPSVMGAIHPRTHTPMVALIAVGSLIGIFALILPLEDLAHYADTVLLLALILVNAALISHRRQFPTMERPFRVPLVPMLPALGIVANLVLLFQIAQHLLPFLLAIASLLVGFVVFFGWKGSRPEEAEMPGGPSRIVLERAPNIAEKRFRVLVPIANPANIEAFIGLAAPIAKERDGEVIALRVVTVPEQVAPSVGESLVQEQAELLERARSRGRELGVPVTALVCVGYNVARAILETAHQRHCDLIILGWKGYTSNARRILGEITDTVVTRARADIAVIRRVGDSQLTNFFLPTAGGEHAQLAADYTSSLARAHSGSLNLCKIVRTKDADTAKQLAEETLAEAMEQLTNIESVHKQVLVSDHVVDCILEQGNQHDAIVLGAAGPASYRQLLLGNIPELVAQKSNKTVIIVKKHNPVKALFGRILNS